MRESSFQTTSLRLGTDRLIDEHGLWNFALNDSDNLRRLAVLINYQSFICNYGFVDIRRTLLEDFMVKNTVTGTYYVYPTRRQILGRMHQLKVVAFLKIWEEVDLHGHFNFFDYITNASLEELVYRHRSRYVVPVYSSLIRLKTEQAADLVRSCREGRSLETGIQLPKSIAHLVSGSFIDEEVPF